MPATLSPIGKLLRTSTFRWLAAYLLVFLAIASIITGYLYWHTNDLLTRQVVQTLAAEVTGLRGQFQLGGMPALTVAVQQRSETTSGALYLLADAGGKRLTGNLQAVPSELRQLPAGALFSYGRGATPGITRLAVGVAIDVPPQAVLVVARDVEEQRVFAETLRRTLLWGLGLISLFGLGGGVIASLGIMRRLDAVTLTSRTIMAGDLSQRIGITGSGDEFDRLAVSLNAMLERIEQLMASMREVSDNIAHDLKTPLSRLRNRLEAVLREPDDRGRYRAALEQTIEDSDDLVRTFNAMLSIARLESGAAGEGMQALDLSALVRDAGEFYEPVAEEAGFALTMDVAEHLPVLGDRQLIGQAVANLIDNAIKYGAGPAVTDPAKPGAIRLKAHATGNDVVIGVADNGPGIAPADRERALERFGRLDASRSKPGSGLGLSLVAAVAKLHQGSVRLDDNGPGLIVTLSLPRLRP